MRPRLEHRLAECRDPRDPSARAQAPFACDGTPFRFDVGVAVAIFPFDRDPALPAIQGSDPNGNNPAGRYTANQSFDDHQLRDALNDLGRLLKSLPQVLVADPRIGEELGHSQKVRQWLAKE
jgi:hypothetical protein